jgi:protein-disulfide isomerase
MFKKRYSTNILVAISMLVATLMTNTDLALAQEPVAKTVVEEARLVQRIKAEVIQDLRKSGLLQQEIDAGIERFVRKQQESQARAPDKRAEKNVRKVSAAKDHVFGNPDAEVSLIEYSDFECPFCKRFHLTAKKVVDSFGGRVNWVYRHFPLDFHNPLAQKEAEASECAAEIGGNDAFWKYSDLIYARTKSNGKGFPLDGLVPLAVEIGLEQKPFKACLDSGRHTARVQADYENGVRSGVSGTPGIILLNNKSGAAKLKAGALPFQTIKAEIDLLLKR